MQTGGTLAALTRTESSRFYLADSLTLSDLEAQLQTGTFQPMLLDAPLQHLAHITLPATAAQKWCQGQRIPVTLDVSVLLRVYDEDQRFVGIGKVMNLDTGVMLIPSMVFEPI